MSDARDAGVDEDRAQRHEKAADTSVVSSQGGSLVTSHSQGPQNEQVQVPSSSIDGVAEDGRRWCRKDNDNFWSAISTAEPWAGVRFKLTKGREEKYEGTYLSGHREDDLVQLQDMLRDATDFYISSPFNPRFVRRNGLQTVADRYEYYLFLLESLANVLRMAENPAPVLRTLSLFGWLEKSDLSDDDRDPTAEEWKELETAKVGALAVRLIVEAANSGKLNNLEELDLHRLRFDETGVQALVDVFAAGHFPSLELSFESYLRQFPRVIQLTVLEHKLESGKLLELTDFGLTNSHESDDACETYEKLMSSGSLEVLNVMHLLSNQIADRGAQALARGFQSGRVKNLAALNLCRNRIGDDGINALAMSLAAGKFPELRELDFRDNSFGTKGIQGLAKALESGNLNSLRKLRIENKRRSEDAAKPLIAALSVNQALTVDMSFDTSPFLFPGLSRQQKQLVERNRKRVELLAQAGGKLVPASFAKVYLCGNPEVGKTTLRKTMTRSHVKSLVTRETKGHRQPRTRGVEISKLTFKGKLAKNDISLVIWDMAGQDEYHQLHNSFLKDLTHTQGKATMFLVMCTSQDIEKAEEELIYWFRFISSSVGHSMADLRDVLVVERRS